MSQLQKQQLDFDRLRAELRDYRSREKAAIDYVREKTDQLLNVMGTLPLKPEELDDRTLISLDPIGIVSESFAQVLEHLRETNEELTLAKDEIQAIFDSAGAGILVVDARMRLQTYNRRSQELFFPHETDVIGRNFRELICAPDQPAEECIFDRVLATRWAVELTDFVSGDRHFHVVGTPVKDKAGEVTQVILVYTDITERKKTEQSLREAEDRLKTIVNALQAGIVVIDAEKHVVVEANDLALQITGRSRESLIGAPCNLTICSKGGPCPITDLGRTIDNRECLLPHADGKRIPILKTVTSVNLNGQSHLLESFIDISQRKATEEALRESEERYRSLYRTMREGVALHELILDDQGQAIDYRILDVNPSYEAILGLERQAVIGRMASEIYGISPAPCLDIYAQVAKTGDSVSFEMTYGPMEKIFSISAVSPARGKFATIFDDITLRKRAEEEVQRLAFFDVLTHLPNRTLLKDRLEQALAHARRAGYSLAVFFLDVDRFKNVNDTLGHAMGDRLLKSLSNRLSSCVRKSDTVARVGGDEFVIILPDAGSQQDVIMTAEKILQVLAPPVELEGREVFGTASIGIALFPCDGEDADELLKNADMAMYRAKDLGGNTFQFYTNEMNAHALDRLVLGNDLRRALERREMILHYQPQLDLDSGRIVGVEALLRWLHPDQGFIPPDKFIPLAEETGMIHSLGRWVLENACRQAAVLHRSGYQGLRMAVNLSGRQFRQADLISQIRKILAETGLDPALLELELTESIVMESAEENKQRLRELKAMGVQLAIDDFGTGYSSLSYLKHFPIDRLKIDRSFVHDIGDNPDAATIAEAIIALAHSLKMKVLAEGVETMRQLDFLKRRFCDEAQGFHVCRPLPISELQTVLASGWASDRIAPTPGF